MESRSDTVREDRNHDSIPAPSKATRFRFKRKRADSFTTSDSLPTRLENHRPSHRHNFRRGHRRSHRAQPPIDDRTTYGDTYLPKVSSAKDLDPDTAFRESLFDALADDEGAAFWESVYGQPIHTYSAYRRNTSDNHDEHGRDGELERMSDEEYTAYVRAKMWEKSHGYVLEERAKRGEERARQKEAMREEAGRRRDRDGLESRIDEALGQSKARRATDEWERVWKRYTRDWEELRRVNEAESRDMDREMHAAGKGRKSLRLPWPVKSGQAKHVGKEAVEDFMRSAPMGSQHESLRGILKAERVRWHPDKIQQHFGSMIAEEGTMKTVTAVFQILDQMWSETRIRQRQS